jgi:hypothetical protein
VFAVYRLIFWIPALASAVMLWAAPRTGFLPRPLPFIVWFVVALVFQVISQIFSPLWAVGLGLQAILAVTLGIKSKLE